jgi:chromosome segregation ATPase
MIDVLLPVVLLVSFATLAVAIVALRSSRRSEEIGENRYELLRDQHDRLELLREERQMLVEELKHESQKRQRFMEDRRPHVVEDLEQARAESASRAEQQEQERQRLEQELRRLEEELEREHKELSGVRQEAQRFGQERQRLAEELEQERQRGAESASRAEQQEQERQRLEQELRRLEEELDRQRQLPPGDHPEKPEAPRPWWRKPVLVIALLVGLLIMWLTSLVVAVNLLYPQV